MLGLLMIGLLTLSWTSHAFRPLLDLRTPLLFLHAAPKRGEIVDSYRLYAAPKRGAIVDSYRSVDISCSKCAQFLFKYKKKNGTKSQLVKMYIERIVADPHSLLEVQREDQAPQSPKCICPKCTANFGRPATIKGRPAIKVIGNRIRMS